MEPGAWLLPELRELRIRAHASRVKVPLSGICANLTLDSGYFDARGIRGWLRQAFAHLGLDTGYPVPSPDGYPRGYAYDQSSHYWPKAYGDNRYAENRMYLLSLLIQLAAGEEVGEVSFPHTMKKVYYAHA